MTVRDGAPVFLTVPAWDEKKEKQPSHILAAQMLQKPAAGTEAMFDVEWLRFSDTRPATLNAYKQHDFDAALRWTERMLALGHEPDLCERRRLRLLSKRDKGRRVVC